MPFKSCGGDPSGPSIVADFTAGTPASNSISLQKNRTSGDTVYLDIKATGVGNVFGASLKLEYDPSKVKWGGTYEEGDFFTGSPTYNVALDGSTGEGKLVIGVSLQSGDTMVSGDGVIITIPLRVIESGNTAIAFSRDSKLTDNVSPIPNEVSVSFSEGTIQGL